MVERKLHELLEKNLISQNEFEKLEPIVSKKLFSVHYELQSLLYLGVMLFTTGAGILVYQNIGELGHMVAIIALGILCGICFWYTHQKATPYTPERVKSPSPYYDYILLLGSLLFVSILGYLQFQYGLLDNQLSTSTLVTSILFFYLAYRYDHVGVLSLALASFYSFTGISMTPQNWYSSDFFSASNLHYVALASSSIVALTSIVLYHKNIKRHFTFTYLNLSLLLFFAASIASLFIEESVYFLFVLLIYGACAFAYYGGMLTHSFLFLVYAFIAGYIATTYFLAETIFNDVAEMWFLYAILSCGGFIYFIIRFKNHFRQSS